MPAMKSTSGLQVYAMFVYSPMSSIAASHIFAPGHADGVKLRVRMKSECASSPEVLEPEVVLRLRLFVKSLVLQCM